MAKKKETKRKTGIPVKNVPRIVEWLLLNCSPDELSFMATLATDRTKYRALVSIINRLAEYNISHVFYARVHNEKELMILREGKLGEVNGLKAFALACQEANNQIEKRAEEVKRSK